MLKVGDRVQVIAPIDSDLLGTNLLGYVSVIIRMANHPSIFETKKQRFYLEIDPELYFYEDELKRLRKRRLSLPKWF